MSVRCNFASVQFRNYKALRNFSVSLRRFNILVGPNNAGKSTILGAFRILAEGIRKANSRKPEALQIAGSSEWGYRINLENLPISTENVFTDYDEENPAKIEFRISNRNRLEIVFPEVGSCYLICRPEGRPITSPATFRTAYPVRIGFVPVLGPVDHEEQLYKQEAARLALLSHTASRNFRNIWWHFSDEFDEFRELIRSSWPGMDIEPPTVTRINQKPYLFMFCPEERYPRELYWAGFGFQVWCQMLTYAMRARNDSLLIIDEPDIYLHSDLQRQLFSFLQDLGPDILIATHSTEIISEAEPSNLLIINKQSKSAKRLTDPAGLRKLFEGLGSNLNPTLTQLAKTRRSLFLEGKDFQILSSFASKLNRELVSRRMDFAVVSVDGFNPERVSDYSKGIEYTLGSKILKGVIFDRDYKSDEEIVAIEKKLSKITSFTHILRRKEIENYLLEIQPLEKAINSRIQSQNSQTGKDVKFTEDVRDILVSITDPLKHTTGAQYQTKRIEYRRKITPHVDEATIAAEIMKEFEYSWEDIDQRIRICPGKEIFSKLNEFLQENYKVSLTHKFVVSYFSSNDVPKEICDIVEILEEFRVQDPP